MHWNFSWISRGCSWSAVICIAGQGQALATKHHKQTSVFWQTWPLLPLAGLTDVSSKASDIVLDCWGWSTTAVGHSRQRCKHPPPLETASFKAKLKKLLLCLSPPSLLTKSFAINITVVLHQSEILLVCSTLILKYIIYCFSLWIWLSQMCACPFTYLI